MGEDDPDAYEEDEDQDAKIDIAERVLLFIAKELRDANYMTIRQVLAD